MYGYTYDQYQKAFATYAANSDPRFVSALYPGRFLLSHIENTPIEPPVLPESLTIDKLIEILQMICNLSIRCIEQILKMLCQQTQLSPEQVKATVQQNDKFRAEVLDLVVDAEKKSKKKVLETVGVEHSHMIIAELLYRDNEKYSKEVDQIQARLMSYVAALGLDTQYRVCCLQV